MENMKPTLRRFFLNRGNRNYRGNEIIRRFPTATIEDLEKLRKKGFLKSRNNRGYIEYKLNKRP